MTYYKAFADRYQKLCLHCLLSSEIYTFTFLLHFSAFCLYAV